MQLKICAKSGLAVTELKEECDWNVAEIAAAHADLMIDALLGTGFKGELGGNYKRACLLMNGARADVLAVDIPSGAQADTGEADENAVQAAATVTMQLPKPGLYLYPAAELAGKVVVAPIGMPEALTEQAEGHKYLLDSEIVRDFLPIRSGNCHKGEAGRVTCGGRFAGLYGRGCACARALSGCADHHARPPRQGVCVAQQPARRHGCGLRSGQARTTASVLHGSAPVRTPLSPLLHCMTSRRCFPCPICTAKT